MTKVRVCYAVVLTILCVVSACACQSTPHASSPGATEPRLYCDLQGHRGARGLAPENTWPAFERAIALGMHTLEMDVGLTRDGVVVVHHDERLNPAITRDQNGEFLRAGPTALPSLRSLTLSQLAAFDVGRVDPNSPYGARWPHQKSHDGTRIPRLRDVIARAESATAGRIRYSIEIKHTPTAADVTAPLTDFVPAVLSVITDTAIVDRTTIQSFDFAVLELVHKAEPRIPTACLTNESPDGDTVERNEPGSSAWLGGLDVDAFDGSTPALVAAAGCTVWSPSLSDLTPEALGEAHRRGLSVVVWTVNEPQSIEHAFDMGVDGIISDYPDRLAHAARARGVSLRAPGSE